VGRTEDRADRWMRRRFGFVDRRALTWGYVNAECAIRDARRELVQAFTPLLTWLARRLP
jgi:hypothetical protein